MQRHGTYERVEPPGARIARWYCRVGQTTFSLLPDCFASHLSGSLEEIEAAASAVEDGATVASASEALRADIELPGAVRWVRRRLRMVRSLLTALVGLMPDLFGTRQPTVSSFRAALGRPDVLVALRDIAAAHLSHLPVPLGFGPRMARTSSPKRGSQQRTGPDPPAE